MGSCFEKAECFEGAPVKVDLCRVVLSESFMLVYVEGRVFRWMGWATSAGKAKRRTMKKRVALETTCRGDDGWEEPKGR